MRTIPTAWGDFRCFEGDAVGDALAEGRFWDAHLKPFMDEAADPEGWAIDVGAYIGFHTCYLAQRYARVVAYEPQPRCQQVWVQNVDANLPTPGRAALVGIAAYSRAVRLVPAAAKDLGWDPAAESNAPSVPFLVASDDLPPDHWNNGLRRGLGLHGRRAAPWGPVRFIKIDAQGCDLHALMGLEGTILRCRPLIVFEWEAGYAAWHGHTWADVEAWAERMRYRVDRITEDYWDYVARPL